MKRVSMCEECGGGFATHRHEGEEICALCYGIKRNLNFRCQICGRIHPIKSADGGWFDEREMKWISACSECQREHEEWERREGKVFKCDSCGLMFTVSKMYRRKGCESPDCTCQLWLCPDCSQKYDQAQEKEWKQLMEDNEWFHELYS